MFASYGPYRDFIYHWLAFSSFFFIPKIFHAFVILCCIGVFFQVVKHFLLNVSPFKIDELLKMGKKNSSPRLSCTVFPNRPPPHPHHPHHPPFRPPSVTHAHSPLIGRLPQVGVKLGRAPQKRRLRASALASSRCDRGGKKANTQQRHTTTARPAPTK